MRKTYIKPELKNVKVAIQNPIIAMSVAFDGNKDHETEEKNPDHIDSRKEESGWNFEW